jgi:hypothetical protein
MVLAHHASAARLNLRGRHLLGALAFTAGLGAVVAGRPRALSLFGAAYLATNARFYALLLRRAGARDALAGVGLLAVHNLASLVSAPIGAAAFARRRRWAPGRGTAAHADGRWDAARWMQASNGSGPVADGARHTVEVLPRSAAA